MKKLLPFFTLLLLTLLVTNVQAQETTEGNPYRDSVVQFNGVVMTADSLRGIASASIIVEGKGRGTITSPDGVFSIAVLKGDKITFSCIGFKNYTISIPKNLTGNQYTWIQLLVTDTVYLPATILKPRPTREQFERDFVNNRVPDDLYEIARKNVDESQRRVLLSSLPTDGRKPSTFKCANKPINTIITAKYLL